MEREACVCDHGFERSDLCAEIIIIIIITTSSSVLGSTKKFAISHAVFTNFNLKF